MTPSNLLTVLIAIPLAGSMVVYLVGRIIHLTPKGKPASSAGAWLALAILALDLVPLIWLYPEVQQGNLVEARIGSVMLRMDGVGMLVSALTLVLGLIVGLFSISYMRGERGEEKYHAATLIMLVALIGLANAGDLFNLWAWFELMAIASAMLVAFYRDQPGALEAGFKYLVQSAAGSVLVVLGIALVFTITGSLNMDSIRFIVQGANPLLLVAGGLFVVGFGVKAALVPMHTWLPDAHSQAPSGISALLSGIVIEAGLIAMLRVLAAIADVSNMWGVLLMAFGAANMLFGNLLALRQQQVKRLLAFSSIAQVGYMLAGFGMAFSFGNLNGAAGGYFHLLTHALMKSAAFLAAGGLLYGIHLSMGRHDSLVLDDLNGAARRYPITALVFSVAVLGLGGLPPMAGFMSKWQIMAAGFQSENTWMILLAVFIALNSVLSLGYYAPLVNRLYRREMAPAVAQGARLPASMTIPLVCLAVLIVAIGLFPSLANDLINPAAQSLTATLAR
ncbi:MAG: hypothetical protein HPY76_09310 [Anaerolineae bacterium]|nr:hypothetical protein [Anaerolineae bacterium]